jgi:hypothetical protein
VVDKAHATSQMRDRQQRSLAQPLQALSTQSRARSVMRLVELLIQSFETSSEPGEPNALARTAQFHWNTTA